MVFIYHLPAHNRVAVVMRVDARGLWGRVAVESQDNLCKKSWICLDYFLLSLLSTSFSCCLFLLVPFLLTSLFIVFDWLLLYTDSDSSLYYLSMPLMSCRGVHSTTVSELSCHSLCSTLSITFTLQILPVRLPSRILTYTTFSVSPSHTPYILHTHIGTLYGSKLTPSNGLVTNAFLSVVEFLKSACEYY